LAQAAHAAQEAFSHLSVCTRALWEKA